MPRSNVLSMMQRGTCKVPIERIPALAAACGVPAGEFIKIAMTEYHPAVWAVLTTAVRALTQDEAEWLSIFDALSKRHKVEVDTDLWISVHLHASHRLEKRRR